MQALQALLSRNVWCLGLGARSSPERGAQAALRLGGGPATLQNRQTDLAVAGCSINTCQENCRLAAFTPAWQIGLRTTLPSPDLEGGLRVGSSTFFLFFCCLL